MQGMSDGSTERSPATVGEQDEGAGLRALPSVERLLQTEPLRSAAAAGGSRTLALGVVRQLLDHCRGRDPRRQRRRARTRRARRPSGRELRALDRPRLVPVINATGVVIHTNLGRAPLPLDALDALEAIGSGYSNLEYDVEHGVRGSRHAHVEHLIRELTGAQAAMAVNNNAAAVLLAVAALAGAARGGGLARSAGRDRWLLQDPRDPGGVGSAPGRGRHHQPDPDRRLRARDRS